MKTILVPTDFSECAEYALKHACFIARKAKAKVILLHVIDKNKISSDGEWMGVWAGEKSPVDVPLMMNLLKNIRKEMKKLMRLPQCNKISIKDAVEIGSISETINASAKRHKADLIIMGTHGASGWNEVFVGSNAEHVVRDAEIPVLSINDGKQKTKFNTILFATDFSEETNFVFPFIKSFSEIFGAKIQMVKITSDSRQREKEKETGENFKAENNLEDYPITILHHLPSKTEGIRRFAGIINADLIAIGTHGRQGLARFFKGSVAEDLVNHAKLPVLTVNFHKKLVEQKIFAQQQVRESKKEEVPNLMYSSHTPII